MRTVPKDNLGAVTFYEVRAPVWQAEAAGIGLSPADAAAVADAAAAARAAFDRQQQAQLAARAATLDYEMALDHLRAVGSTCIAKIRLAAADDAAGGEGAGDDVYGRALVPAPANPARLPAPGKPTGFDATLLVTGAVRLAWRCPNPPGAAGTLYEIRRRDVPARGGGGGDDFAFVAVVGTRRFVDATIPPGTATVEYQVTAVRSTRRGAAGHHVVNFAAARAAAA